MNSRKLCFILLITIVSSILTSCGGSPQKLTIGLIPLKDAAEMKADFEPIRIYLEERLGLPIEVVAVDNYVSLIEGMKDAKIDIGWYGAFSYIAAESEMELTPLIVQQRKDTGMYYNSLIIVHKDLGIHSFEEVEGKKFAFVDSGSTSGYVLPYTLFKSRHIDYETFFSETYYAGSHEQVAFDIQHKQADAGAISSTQYNNLIRDGKVQPEDMDIIWKSEDIPGSPYVASSDLDKSIQENFTIAMLNIHSEAPTILENYDDSIERYVEVESISYNPIRNIATILGKEYMYEHFLKSE